MLKQQEGITVTATEEGMAVSIILLFHKSSTPQRGKMGGWGCVLWEGNGAAPCLCPRCLLCLRQKRLCNGSAAAHDGQAGPKPHGPPVPLFVPSLPSCGGGWIPLHSAEPFLSSSLSPVTPFAVAGTAHLQTKMAKFSFSSIVYALH